MNKNVLIGFLSLCLVGVGVFIFNEKKSSTVIDTEPVLPVEVFESVEKDNDAGNSVASNQAVAKDYSVLLTLGQRIVFGRDIKIKEFGDGTDRLKEYRVEKVQQIQSADGGIKHLAFLACPNDTYSVEFCERFVVNNEGYAVPLEEFGRPEYGSDEVASFDLSSYPYIYTAIQSADGTLNSAEWLVGFDVDNLQREVFWNKETYLVEDDKCILLTEESEPSGHVRIDSYSLGSGETTRGLYIKRCTSNSDLNIYSAPPEIPMKNPLIVEHLAVASYKTLTSNFSSHFGSVIIKLDEQSYEYDFKTDKLKQLTN